MLQKRAPPMNTKRQRMPVLFVGHGNPMNAIEQNDFHRTWQELGRTLPRPEAVLCISAHWETQGVAVTVTSHPETIHDFYGFPRALFEVRYPAPGAPDLARRVAGLLAGDDVRLDPDRGLDHGAWSVLAPMYPGADVPIVQLSLDSRRPGEFHYRLGKALAPLREEGVLILASGNIVHNLRLLDYRDPRPPAWAVEADASLRSLIEAGDHGALIEYGSLGEAVRRGIPTPEHYLPLLYALALQDERDAPGFFNTAVWGSISMTSLLLTPGDSSRGPLSR